MFLESCTSTTNNIKSTTSDWQWFHRWYWRR